MLPADKCFNANDLSSCDVYKWLVDELELSMRSCCSKILFKRQSSNGLEIHAVIVELVAITASILGTVQGGVSVFEKRVNILSIRRIQGNTNARRDV